MPASRVLYFGCRFFAYFYFEEDKHGFELHELAECSRQFYLGTTAFGSFGGNRDSADTSFEDVAGFQASQGFEINFQGTERRQRRY